MRTRFFSGDGCTRTSAGRWTSFCYLSLLFSPRSCLFACRWSYRLSLRPPTFSFFRAFSHASLRYPLPACRCASHLGMPRRARLCFISKPSTISPMPYLSMQLLYPSSVIYLFFILFFFSPIPIIYYSNLT